MNAARGVWNVGRYGLLRGAGELERTTIRVGVMDSSFNPPTIAHLEMMNTTAQEFNLDCMVLLLALKNADKGEMKADHDERRIEMMKLVAGECTAPASEVCLTDQPLFADKIPGIMSYFDREYPNVAPELYVIMGLDTIVRVIDPKYYNDSEESRDEALQTLFGQIERLVCFQRVDEASSIGLSWLENKITFLPEPGSNVSSSECRRQLQSSGTSSLLPDVLQTYVQAHNLYK